jgi:apolipoprotein N-acyltransferase
MLVPWLALLDRAGSVPTAVAAAVLMAVGFVLAVFAWFAGAIASYTALPPGVALGALLVAAPLLQPQLVVLAIGRHLGRRRGFAWAALTGALLYVGAEWLLPKLFADTLGHGLYASRWLRQAADLTGAPGLTCALLLGNECVLAVVRAARGPGFVEARTPVLAFIGVVGGLALYGALRCVALASPASDGPLTAALVQADISGYDRLAAEQGTYEAVREILNQHFALSDDALRQRRPDVLVWPETVYPTTFGSPKSEDGAVFDRAIAAFVAGKGVPLVFGAYDAEDGHEYNAAMFLEPSAAGRLAFDAYRKATLFPLTERVPDVLDSTRVRRWMPWLGTWKPGSGTAVVPLHLADGRTIRVAPLICYDAVDPRLALDAVRAGAEVIVTLSNDSWFAAGMGPRLHLVVSAFRTLETRRAPLRATNTGISAVIAPTGDLLATAGVHERRAVVGTVVPEGRAWTLMLAWGDWFGPTALAAGLVALLVALLRPARA